MFIKLCPPMQSPKFPVYNAGYRSTGSDTTFPLLSVACTVSEESSARTEGIKVLRRTNAVAHADAEKQGNRAMLSERKGELLVYAWIEMQRIERGASPDDDEEDGSCQNIGGGWKIIQGRWCCELW